MRVVSPYPDCRIYYRLARFPTQSASGDGEGPRDRMQALIVRPQRSPGKEC